MSETDAAPDAARSDEIDRLRRVAFGRTSGAAGESAARAALVELARLEAERAAEQAAETAARAAATEAARLAAVPHVEPEPASPCDPAVAAEAADEAEPRRWRRWLAPAAAGVLVGALIAGGIALALPRPTATTGAPGTAGAADGAAPDDLDYFLGDPGDESTSTDGTIAGMTGKGGDPRAAERWFAEPQTADDLADVGTLLPEYDRGSVRLVHASEVARVWVAKRVDGQLCLEVTVQQTDYSSGSCALPPDFSARGLTVSSDAVTVRWNGGQVNVLLAPRAAE